MCGIVGFWGAEASVHVALQSCAQMRCRGPDGEGAWMDEGVKLVLAHTRLSVLELSDAGKQPMGSACGRYVITFNGEIYNHLDLRRSLAEQSPQWRGTSDTETLLGCFSVWGVHKTIRNAVGMFAFAVWDAHERKLILGRDRLGEKPIYYGYIGETFVFCSELKGFRALSSFKPEIDRASVSLLLRHNYIPAPYTIYRDVHKVRPGTLLTLSAEAAARREAPHEETYWCALEVAASCVGNPYLFRSDRDAIDALETELKGCVSSQMISDVPLGAFLSGGVDSSVVVAMMQQSAEQPVRTFSIGFLEDRYDEARYARAVANHLGTSHSELYCSESDALEMIPILPEVYDEPFSDSSQLPTLLVSRMAREHVTVALSGDGGDELFGGYRRYFLAARLWRGLGRIPRPLRAAGARMLLSFAPATWDRVLESTPLLRGNLRASLSGDRIHKAAALIEATSGVALYHQMVSHWSPAEVVLHASEPETALTGSAESLPFETLAEKMMVLDAISYLPGDILTKVDRAAMSVSLETRVPLLDHRLFEFAWRLPMQYKIRGGTGKWLLRQVLHRHVPRHLIDRPKMGFGIPLDAWLRGPLREWAQSLLDESRIAREQFFNSREIAKKWREHLAGTRNWQYHLWDVLMFQAWKERWHP